MTNNNDAVINIGRFTAHQQRRSKRSKMEFSLHSFYNLCLFLYLLLSDLMPVALGFFQNVLWKHNVVFFHIAHRLTRACAPWHMHGVSVNMQVQKTTSGHHTEPRTLIRACELTLWWINADSLPHFLLSMSRWRQLLEIDIGAITGMSTVMLPVHYGCGFTSGGNIEPR